MRGIVGLLLVLTALASTASADKIKTRVKVRQQDVRVAQPLPVVEGVLVVPSNTVQIQVPTQMPAWRYWSPFTGQWYEIRIHADPES